MPIPNCHTIFCLRMIEVSNEMKIIKELHKVENNIKYLIDNENLKNGQNYIMIEINAISLKIPNFSGSMKAAVYFLHILRKL